MSEIKAIETVYNGYRFRSRLEARWAVFFDALGVPYEYEKEGYDLGEAGWYLPDFWLPREGIFWEIKHGEEYHHQPKGYALAKQSRRAVICSFGDPCNYRLRQGIWSVRMFAMRKMTKQIACMDSTLLTKKRMRS